MTGFWWCPPVYPPSRDRRLGTKVAKSVLLWYNFSANVQIVVHKRLDVRKQKEYPYVTLKRGHTQPPIITPAARPRPGGCE